jgi:hypothetical protein
LALHPGTSVAKTIRLFAFALLITALHAVASAQDKHDGGWSADLLNQILKADPMAPESAPTSADHEMVLRTYRLTHLHVAEAGRVQNVLGILRNLLPPGSSMKTDVPDNSIHVLTTLAAHKAVWDYLSAVDIAEPTATAPAAGVPDDVQMALKKLAEAGDHSATLLKALASLQSDVAAHFAEIDARQRQQTMKVVAGVAAFALMLVGTVGWMVRRRPAPAVDGKVSGAALALAPDQLATALTPVHDHMRSDMLGLLNEVAIKLQAQHNEQQKLVREQQQQLEEARHALADERRQFINEAGTMVVQAVERVDATTAKLAKQQDKVAELVQELQQTVRELDETKDNLRHREVELEQERAKIAALSILLEEGSPVPATRSCNGHPAGRSLTGADENNHNGADAGSAASDRSMPCTTPDQPCQRTTPELPETSNPPKAFRFTFLPPNHPET